MGVRRPRHFLGVPFRRSQITDPHEALPDLLKPQGLVCSPKGECIGADMTQLHLQTLTERGRVLLRLVLKVCGSGPIATLQRNA